MHPKGERMMNGLRTRLTVEIEQIRDRRTALHSIDTLGMGALMHGSFLLTGVACSSLFKCWIIRWTSIKVSDSIVSTRWEVVNTAEYKYVCIEGSCLCIIYHVYLRSTVVGGIVPTTPFINDCLSYVFTVLFLTINGDILAG